ncbi:hypothetical protein BDV33DRAFT_186026 [Aspergillus novoparasiticus]|uniref:Uncharacterized protein n=1 Tax=Aspergillus novoparasiticus TaxID=986946 RepID=A0A5N6E5L2_9EURO|nr:hypothetical protein BDV33DRAFT_186026 [Aspergillus novoparasiticus]
MYLLCYNRGAKSLARDVPILSGELLEAHNFERMFGWWRRLLLRGPIKIQMVKMHVLRQRNSKEVEVMILPIDIAAEVERFERALEQCEFHPECSAGFSEDGTLIPCSRPKNCRNLTMGGTEEYPQFYCSLERHHRLRRRKRRLEHSEALLEFYWSSRGRSDFLGFLEYRGFITRYRDLETTHFLDACDGCGEGILALLLVDGWHTQRLLVLVGLAVLLNILITILGAAVGQSINMGLTAGSYTFALVAVIIATLSFFSAIL